jgi:anti-sigma-K factor RskA
MDVRELHDLTAAYALDALDADEAEAYEAHLARCERCRAELATLTETAGALAWAVDAPAPPPGLRARVLDAAAAERANVVPLTGRPAWVFRATAAAAAVAACAAVGLAVWAGVLSRSLHHERSARAADARAAQILADPAAQRIDISGGDGLVAVSPEGEGVLVVRRLPAAPAGKTYEAWVIPRGGAPKPAGLFRGGAAATIVRLRQPVPRGAVVAATVEQSGGATAPTGTPIFSART